MLHFFFVSRDCMIFLFPRGCRIFVPTGCGIFFVLRGSVIFFPREDEVEDSRTQSSNLNHHSWIWYLFSVLEHSSGSSSVSEDGRCSNCRLPFSGCRPAGCRFDACCTSPCPVFCGSPSFVVRLWYWRPHLCSALPLSPALLHVDCGVFVPLS